VQVLCMQVELMADCITWVVCVCPGVFMHWLMMYVHLMRRSLASSCCQQCCPRSSRRAGRQLEVAGIQAAWVGRVGLGKVY
jgi:hypothetical protein